MAIGKAVQDGMWVYVYNENGVHLYSKPVGAAKGDGLTFWSYVMVNIRYGNKTLVFNDEGEEIGHFPAAD